jgi:hypothetical protein
MMMSRLLVMGRKHVHYVLVVVIVVIITVVITWA